MPIKDRQQKKIDLIWSTWVDQRMDDTGCVKVMSDIAWLFCAISDEIEWQKFDNQLNFAILHWTAAVKRRFMRDVYPRRSWNDVHKILWFLLPRAFSRCSLSIWHYWIYFRIPCPSAPSGRHSRIVPLIAHAWPARLRLHNRGKYGIPLLPQGKMRIYQLGSVGFVNLPGCLMFATFLSCHTNFVTAPKTFLLRLKHKLVFSKAEYLPSIDK